MVLSVANIQYNASPSHRKSLNHIKLFLMSYRCVDSVKDTVGLAVIYKQELNLANINRETQLKDPCSSCFALYSLASLNIFA